MRTLKPFSCPGRSRPGRLHFRLPPISLGHAKNGTFDEADERFRSEAFARGAPANHDPLPLCAVGAVNIRAEANLGSSEQKEKNLILLKKDRTATCAEEFYQYQPGFSPKEHVEMRTSERLVQIAEERKKDDENRAEARLRADQEWRKEQDALNRKWNGAFVLVAAIIGLIGVVIGAKLSTPPESPVINVIVPKTEATHK